MGFVVFVSCTVGLHHITIVSNEWSTLLGCWVHISAVAMVGVAMVGVTMVGVAMIEVAMVGVSMDWSFNG